MSGKLWCLLSGGKDSICAAHVLSRQGRLAGCVFIDTGIACPDTRPFVERLCGDQGWDLRVYASPKRYEDLVMKYGFPRDLVGHSWAYGALKERALRAAFHDLGPGTVFASGVRRRESKRRAMSVARGFRHNYGIVIENPIQEWTNEGVWSYLRKNDLSVSPSYVALGRSGDCLCGAFSHRREQSLIQAYYPEVAARIRRLERSLDPVQHPFPTNRWGSSRSRGGFSLLDGQTTLEAMVCGGDCADAPRPTEAPA